MPAFEWVHVQLHQQKGMISLSPPTICNSASAHETITLVNASIILKKEEYEYSTFSCRPYSLFCGILPSCFCSPRNAGESKRC
ncbi:beta-lactamase TEM domain protein [Escherichia coli 2861200]|nr:beta-lactamase TEM domain protein [Escherichia coli 2861200]KEJ22203.1 ampicillin resistance domain protein [Escherichia coli 2-316-03_S1_C1]